MPVIIMSYVVGHLAIHLNPFHAASHHRTPSASLLHHNPLPQFFLLLILHQTPRMLRNSLDPNPPLHIPIKHLADQINALLAHNVRNPQIMVHDLVDTIERVLLVDDRVEQDAESPDVLFFAAVGEAAEDFGGGVIYRAVLVGCF